MHSAESMASATLLAGLAGLVLGAFFFGSLWWSVRRILSCRPSWSSHLGLLLARVGLTLFGFYAVGAGHWERLLACLAGFLVARLATSAITRHWDRSTLQSANRARLKVSQEAGHAPQS